MINPYFNRHYQNRENVPTQTKNINSTQGAYSCYNIQMGSLDDMPNRGDTHEIAEKAEIAFRRAIEDHNYFLIQQEDRRDYGTDFQVEARDGQGMTNARVHVQVKGNTYLRKGSSKDSEHPISVSIKRTNLNYLLNQAFSIYICFHIPSNRLMVRSADDVFAEHEHKDPNWYSKPNLSVKFNVAFDEAFQKQLHAQVLIVHQENRDLRLKWRTTPLEKPLYLTNPSIEIISVPSDSKQALSILKNLYESGNDQTISNYFNQFKAVLENVPGGMDITYLAEINLSINYSEFNADRIREGISYFKNLIKHPKLRFKGSLLYNIGNGWFGLEEYEKAKSLFIKALPILKTDHQKNEEALCAKNLGSVLERLGEVQEAKTYFEYALAINANLGEANFALARWHTKNDQNYLLGLDYLDKVIIPNNASNWQYSLIGWRAELLFLADSPKEAFRDIFTLLSHAQRFEWIWSWCSGLVSYFGKRSILSSQKSIQFWSIYKEAFPEDRLAELETLLCHWFLNENGIEITLNFKDFKSKILHFIESGESSLAFLWDRIGHWAQKDGDWTEAEENYRKAYNLEPQKYGYCLGTSLNFLKRYEEALPILVTEAEVHQPDTMSWFQVGVAKGGLKDLEGSIRAYKKAIELDPNYDIAWFNLGAAYFGQADLKNAFDVWEVAVNLFPDYEGIDELLANLDYLLNNNDDSSDQFAM